MVWPFKKREPKPSTVVSPEAQELARSILEDEGWRAVGISGVMRGRLLVSPLDLSRRNVGHVAITNGDGSYEATKWFEGADCDEILSAVKRRWRQENAKAVDASHAKIAKAIEGLTQ